MRVDEVWTSDNPVADAHRAHLERWVREEGCRRAGAHDVTVTIESDGEATTVVVDRRVPLEVGGPAGKVLGGGIRVVQTERWTPPGADGVSRADISVAFPGAPVTMTAAALIVPTEGGSRETVTGEVKVKVPVVGRAVEPEVVRQIVRSLRTEMATGLEWLAAGH